MNARDRLDAIAARAEAATEGPWLASHNMTEDTHDVSVLYSNGIGVVIADCRKRDTDAEFIAHARADVPALVAFATAVLDELHTPFTADFAGVGARTYCVQCTEDSGYTAYPCAHVEAINRLADEHLGGTS